MYVMLIRQIFFPDIKLKVSQNYYGEINFANDDHINFNRFQSK